MDSESLPIMSVEQKEQRDTEKSSSFTGELSYPEKNAALYFDVAPDWPNHPSGISRGAVSGTWVDEEDRVWMFTRATPSVQVYSPQGEYLFGWQHDPDGAAHQIKMDREGHVWLADVGLHVVRKHRRDGQVLLTLGTPGEPGNDSSHFNTPTDMAIASNGDIFVTDGYGNARVMHFDRNGTFLKSWGSIGSGDGELSLPHAIAIDSRDRIYVADRNNVRIQIYNTGGELLDSWGNLMVPWGFWISKNDELWVCGSTPMEWRFDKDYPGMPLGCAPKDQVFLKFSPGGRVLQIWSVPKATDGQEKPGELNWVHCLAFDSAGDLYCGDIVGKRLQKFLLRTK
jgi:sugar lactone lactonase YvrE